MKRLYALTALLALTGGAYANAACTSPAGQAGDVGYSSNLSMMVFCDGTNWVSMSGGANVTVGGNVNNPAGNDNELQFKSGTGFGSSSGLTWTAGTNTLNATNIAGTITTAAQPNITSLGTLTGLMVNGTISTTALTVNGVAITGNASGDRITSGTATMLANSASGYISLTTGATTWGYLGSSATYLPTVNAAQISTTNVSFTMGQVNGNTVGAMAGGGGNYIVSGTTQVSTSSAGSITFVTNNTQAMGIDSSGRVGIGTPTPAEKLSINGGLGVYGDYGTLPAPGGLKIGSGGSSPNMTSIAWGDNTGWKLNFGTNASSVFTPRITFTDTGNVGIGTTTPAAQLEVSGSIYVRDQNGSSTNKLSISYGGTSGIATFAANNAASSTEISFGTSNAGTYGERMRIGKQAVTVGTSMNCQGSTGCSRLAVNFTGGGTEYGLSLKPNSDNTVAITFGNAAGNPIGSISTGTGSTNFNTTSDRRLKENITESGKGLAELGKIHVSDFNFIADPSKTKVQGFIAQDLYKVYPEAVTVGGADPKQKPWSVDYGRLTPLLVKAVQELKVENDTLRQKLQKTEAQEEKLRQDMNEMRAELKKMQQQIQAHPGQ